MSAWLPALKAVLPYVTQVVTAAIPHFTARKGDNKSPDLMPQQIAELQDAVTANAKSIKLLAEQLERTVKSTENAASDLENVLSALRVQLDQQHHALSAVDGQLKSLASGQRRSVFLAIVAILVAAASITFALASWANG